jgi:hypothetical protein
MKLKEFIKKLDKVAEKYGELIEVKMADGISVKNPVYLKKFLNKKAVIITDRK